MHGGVAHSQIKPQGGLSPKAVLLPLLHQRDIFDRMATGSAKSLCMFLGPLAISEEAIVGVVISPMKALMD